MLFTFPAPDPLNGGLLADEIAAAGLGVVDVTLDPDEAGPEVRIVTNDDDEVVDEDALAAVVAAHKPPPPPPHPPTVEEKVAAALDQATDFASFKKALSTLLADG